MLEVKLYLGNNLVCSIASEAIQNSEEYINQSEKKIKKDFESKALNSEEKTGIVGENIILQDNFDMKA